MQSECEKHGAVTKVVLRGPPQEVLLVRIFVQFAAHASAEAAVAVSEKLRRHRMNLLCLDITSLGFHLYLR